MTEAEERGLQMVQEIIGRIEQEAEAKSREEMQKWLASPQMTGIPVSPGMMELFRGAWANGYFEGWFAGAAMLAEKKAKEDA